MNTDPRADRNRPPPLLLLATAFAAGALGCWLILHHSVDKPALPPNAAEIFALLAQHGDTVFPEQGLSCELHASNGRLRIDDFIASYLQWSYGTGRHMRSSLDCEGDPLRNCVWMFGENKSSEGWGRFLRFQYDRRSQILAPETLACIDVP